MIALRYRLEAVVFRSMLLLARLAPRRLLLATGSLVGRIGYHLDARHRRIALDNVRLAYGPEVDPAWAREVVRRCWRHFGRITLDSLAIYGMPLARVERLVRVEGADHLRRAYERGKGVLIFSGHYGHWELSAIAQAAMGYPMAVVARPLDNPHLERILAGLRGRAGNRVIHKHDALREMIRTLRDKIGLAVLIDQDARADGIFVPFFGRLASTTPAVGLLAVRTGATVLPSFSVPQPDGTYVVYYGPPVETPGTGDRERDAATVTAECTAVIERWIREHPEIWLWMHRRWKTPPPPC